MTVVFFVPFLRPWWWLFAPLALSVQLKTVYLWWLRWDCFYEYPKMKWTILEIIPPKEVLIPIKAMEDVFSVIWGPVYDVANWREIWCEGELNNAPYWMSCEIVSIEGRVHFYLRVKDEHRIAIESSLYAHYSSLEIHEAPDYVKKVPQSIPNDQWDLYGEEFVLANPAPYPIKTYEKFFEPQGERISAEEKRIDPINSLLDSMSQLGTGEQFWLQMIIMAVGDYDEPGFKREAEEIISKKAKRPTNKRKTFVEELFEIFYNLVFGPKKEESGDKATYKWVESAKSDSGEREMVITPGEREVIAEVENKIKKPIFKTVLRGMYVAKRDNWKASNKTLSRSYFSHFTSNNLNYLRFTNATRTRVHFLLRERRVFLRARRMMRNAVLRFTPLFPDRKKECPILNTEELATLFHFPIKAVGSMLPSMVMVESKKGGPPPNLPTE